MRTLLAVLAFPVFLSNCAPVRADSTTISAQVASEREPDDFGHVIDTVYKFQLAHAFDSGVTLDGFFEVSEPAGGGPAKQNFEGNVGYKQRLMGPLGFSVSAGVGERLTSTNDFPYYVFRIGGDLQIGERLSWNFLSFRYRDAFDAGNGYYTPRFTTKLTFHVDNSNAVYGELYRNFDKEWDSTATGIGVGYAYKF